MRKITKIEIQKNNASRFNIYIDDHFELGVSEDTLVKLNLKKGDNISTQDLDHIKQHEFQQQAIQQALHHLSYRKRSAKEIAKHLKKQDFPEAVIEKAIAFCRAQRLIDHEDYVESLKNTLLQTTDKGPEIFKQKLIEAGIEETLIQKGVEQYEAEQSKESIIKLANKIKSRKKGPPKKVQQQVHQSLIQKGYTFDTIRDVLAALDFSEDHEMIDELLQRDLEKVYNKYVKKYEGYQLRMKTTEALVRKGYSYDDISRKLEESGIIDES
ncbi:recombination regulator RecX [Staphylococcus agnetis]|uniref:recombination regulator RecX n=1 Tax=Staphylococcus TaxID=1279 RepID=UPI000D19CD76|nr:MULTISPECIES: recombination regulator RecX [Staphylococcus]MCO4326377.1 recombination regulator RecX [Staphylococcus agnetis]MCO4357211.1 recombination regulator RecX [Staphylococcus agnetis]MCO4362008.1 recombination regulator RecX [Staphylococcus agnetis]MCO4369520.1 recombination regulator RecX [Staphylococcus agnetis]NHM76087.1 recombination regulator RecX [Staphylococcus sp. 11007852]